MALERKLLAVPAQTLTSTGTSDGQITIAKPGLFKARQFVFVGAPSQPTLELEVKRIALGIIFLGPRDNNPETRSDLSAYPSGTGFIFANEQVRPFIPKDEIIPNYRLEDYEHEEEPTVARRSILVDAEGEKIDVIVTSGIRRLAVDLGAQVTVTTSGVQDVNVVNSPTVGVAGVVQVSGVVSFQRPVDVRVIEQPPSTATISGIITTSGIAEQPVRIDQVVRISGIVDVQRPVQVVLDSGVRIADVDVTIDVEIKNTQINVTVSGVTTVTVSGIVAVSGISEQPVRIENVVRTSGVVDFQRPIQVHGVAPDSAPNQGFPVRVGSKAVEIILNSGVEVEDVVDLIADRFRRIYVNDSPNIKVISSQSGVGTHPGPLLTQQLIGRRRIQIQNLGPSSIFIGDSDVQSGIGLRILPNGTNTLEAGDKIVLFAVAASGVADIRLLQLA